MTQRVFDVDNPQEIFDLFPDDVIRIEKSDRKDGQDIIIFNDDRWDFTRIKINWRDKTEITRPVDESQWIGKLCWFQEEKNTMPFIGVLESIKGDEYNCAAHLTPCKVCRPVRRSEVQFVEDEK